MNRALTAGVAYTRSEPRKDYKSEFLWQLKVCGLPTPEREYRFHPKRRYRFDWAYVGMYIAFEYEGGLRSARSGHRSFGGVMRDIAKYNLAQSMGWRVFRITPQMVKSGEAVNVVEKAIRREAIE